MLLHAVVGLALLAMSPEPADKLPSCPEGVAWQLVWNDEFEGKVLDHTKWDVPVYERRGHLWRAENAYLDCEGSLVIETSKVGDRFASACVRTSGAGGAAVAPEPPGCVADLDRTRPFR